MTTLQSLKSCYCHACGKRFHPLGIARHRKAHLDREGYCEITYTNGIRYSHRKKKKGRVTSWLR